MAETMKLRASPTYQYLGDSETIIAEDKMDQPLISIIVPVYKVETYLRQCVDSILNQTYNNLEVLLVDDGSPDNCPKICDDYAMQDTRIRVIHKTNGGLSDARNAALEVCAGEYIAFVDSDDWIEPQMYSDMMAMMSEKDLEIVFCTVREIVDGEAVGIRYHYFPDGTVMDAKEVQKLALKDEIAAAVWMRLCKKDCFNHVRFPVGRNYEDIAVTFLPFERADKVGFLDRPYYNYRINKSGIAHQKKPLTRYQMFLSYRDCYDYAVEHVPEVKAEICALVARFALGTFLDCQIEDEEKLRQIQPEIEQFLLEHRNVVLCSRRNSVAVKMMIMAYYNCKPLLKTLYRIAYPILKMRWN